MTRRQFLVTIAFCVVATVALWRLPAQPDHVGPWGNRLQGRYEVWNQIGAEWSQPIFSAAYRWTQWPQANWYLAYEYGGPAACFNPPHNVIVVCLADVPAPLAAMAGWWNESNVWLGSGRVARGIVHIEGNWPPETRQPVVCHELGHILGLDHRNDNYGVPTSCLLGASRPDSHDYEQLQEMYDNL